MNELIKFLTNTVEWCIANNHLVAWIFAALAGSAYKIYTKRVHDQAAIDDLKFIVNKAKDYAHVVNGNNNIPLTDIKQAIVIGVQQAVAAYNANTKTRHINVTNQQISNAADIAIDFYNQYFGGFSQATPTHISDEDIEKATEPDATPSSVATVNNTTVASNTPSSASSASSSAAPVNIDNDTLKAVIKEFLKEGAN